MADKSISELVAATAVGSTDLFVLEQTGTAKKLTGQILENWLVSFADGHGGIQSIVYTAPATGSRVGYMLITLADETEVTVPVTDGRSILNLVWSESGTSGDGQTHTGTFSYNDGTTSTITIKDGVKGDTGAQTYVHFRWADNATPTDAQLSTTPDDYIGIYVGLSETAPTTASSYSGGVFFQWKGDTGDPAELDTAATTYQVSNSGTTIPTGTWVDEPPYVAPGAFLWTRVILQFNTGDPVTYYTVSRYGVDGQGSPGTATPLPDSTTGAVGTSESFSREDHQHPLPVADDILMDSGNTVEDDVSELLTFEALHITGTISSTAMYLTDSRITADMRVLECTIGTPSNVTTDLTWTTAAGQITFSGTVSAATTIDLILGKTN